MWFALENSGDDVEKVLVRRGPDAVRAKSARERLVMAVQVLRLPTPDDRAILALAVVERASPGTCFFPHRLLCPKNKPSRVLLTRLLSLFLLKECERKKKTNARSETYKNRKACVDRARRTVRGGGGGGERVFANLQTVRGVGLEREVSVLRSVFRLQKATPATTRRKGARACGSPRVRVCVRA